YLDTASIILSPNVILKEIRMLSSDSLPKEIRHFILLFLTWGAIAWGLIAGNLFYAIAVLGKAVFDLIQPTLSLFF
ncbi:MAG: hypothetical protein WCD42_02335, partial [Rhizomicrobium sp.]